MWGCCCSGTQNPDEGLARGVCMVDLVGLEVREAILVAERVEGGAKGNRGRGRGG